MLAVHPSAEIFVDLSRGRDSHSPTSERKLVGTIREKPKSRGEQTMPRLVKTLLLPGLTGAMPSPPRSPASRPMRI